MKPEQEIRDFIRADDNWETVGHTPLPGLVDLRNWDRRLLETWKPLYVPVGSKCNQCNYGECDLAEDKTGVCGINISTFQARINFQACCSALASIINQCNSLLRLLAARNRLEAKLDLGDQIGIEAPLIRTVLGFKPNIIADLDQVMAYLESQLISLQACCGSDAETSSLDLESLSMHASLLSHVAMELSEIAQIAGLGLPSSKADMPLVDIGPAGIDPSKPVILLTGECNVTAVYLAGYLREKGLTAEIQLAAVGQTAQDMARHYPGVKILGLTSQMPEIIGSGLADVVICGRGSRVMDIHNEVIKKGTAFIATAPAACYGLPDMTAQQVSETVNSLSEGQGALIMDWHRTAEVAVATAQKISKERKREAASWKGKSGRMRCGRGPIMDTEIRKVGAPLVLGTIPGVIAIVGSSHYPGPPEDIAEIAEEFAKRKYIVVLAGDSAIAAGLKLDDDGRSIYEKYPSDFDAGGVINVGSVSAGAHISGAAIKIASLFAALPLRANFEIIADYILNRVGAAGLAWGACGEEELALATGCNRLGIPVVVGPNCIKYARLYLSKAGESDWSVMDGREKTIVNTGEPSPEHLINLLDDKKKVMVALAKLCMRKNDTPQGRSTKLTHYIGLHKKHFGSIPDDVHLFIRRSADIPIFYKKEVQARLTEIGWQEKPVLSLPTFIGTYRTAVKLEEVVR